MRARWNAGPGSAVLLLGVVALLELWAARAADPDFFLPDPFRPLIIGLVVLYVLAGLSPWGQLRRGLFTLIFAVPLLLLVMEYALAARDHSSSSFRLAPSDDALLRYTYRPGARLRDVAGELTVTADGLWDQAHDIPKPAGVRRVVILGDSVPNDPSLPFASRFPHVLEGLLSARSPGDRVEVINVSCEGYSTLQEVRLLEKVGLRYEPDLIVVAYVLNDPFLQNGAYRRFGNSFFAFQVGETVGRLAGRSMCPMFARLHEGYGFDLMVRASFERLRLITQPLQVPVLVATLPIVEKFDDAVCLQTYDQVLGVARAQGFAGVRVVDAFQGLSAETFLKPQDKNDITHPNADGHARIARVLAETVAPMLWPPPR